MHPTRLLIARIVLPPAVLVSTLAHARPRPHFEPTDLDLEETGVVELDLQMGAIRSPGPWRAVLPDFELDLGLLPNLELGLDGSYAIEGPTTGSFSFDHAAPDSLWPSLKMGLYDNRDDTFDRAWAIGVALGPKLPVASHSHGVGFESLLLVGRFVRQRHVFLNLGIFVDPAADTMTARPIGIEAGLDISVDLGDQNRVSVIGGISGLRFWSSDPNQLLATAGCSWAVTPHINTSLSALYGFLPGSDRYGLLLGLSPKMRLFGR